MFLCHALISDSTTEWTGVWLYTSLMLLSQYISTTAVMLGTLHNGKGQLANLPQILQRCKPIDYI